MTDQRLHDLLHETVSDVTAPDLADTAWRSGVRARRRRTAALAAGATAGWSRSPARWPSSTADRRRTARPPDRRSDHQHPDVRSHPDREALRPRPRPGRALRRGPGVVVADPGPGGVACRRTRTARLPAIIDLERAGHPLADHPIRHAVAAFAASTAAPWSTCGCSLPTAGSCGSAPGAADARPRGQSADPRRRLDAVSLR